MGIQTSVGLYPETAYEGQIATFETSNIVSRVNVGTTVIPFGSIVVTDGTEKGIKAAKDEASIDDTSKVLGVLVRTQDDITQGNTAGLLPNRVGSIMTMGTIWVRPTEAVTYGKEAFIGKGTNVKGQFRAQASSAGDEAIELKDVKYRTSADANKLAMISIKIGG